MAKRKKNKETVYSKQRKRIVNYVSRLKRKGYRINLYYPTELELRKQGIKGSKLTELTRELKKVTPELIRSMVEPNIDTTTNESGFIPEANINADNSFFDEAVIQEWYSTLLQFSSAEAFGLLRSWMDSTIAQNGKHNTAIMLQRGHEAGNILTWSTVYKRDNAVKYIGNMIDYLPDQGVLYKEETLDKIEFMKRLGDAFEYDEDWEQPL